MELIHIHDYDLVCLFGVRREKDKRNYVPTAISSSSSSMILPFLKLN